MSVYLEAPDDATPELTRGGSSSSRCGDSTSATTVDLLEDTHSTSSSVYSCASSCSVQVIVRVRPLLGEKEKECCLETLFDRKNLTLHSTNKQTFRKHPSILRLLGKGAAATETSESKAKSSHFKNKINKANSNGKDNSQKMHTSKENGGQTFCYDEVFPESATQAEVFQYRIEPLVQRCLNGYNASVLAYGQTSSGKTYTMTGPPIEPGRTLSKDQVGVIPRAIQQLFEGLEVKRREEASKEAHRCNVKYSYQVRVQFLELYKEDLRDLLHDSSQNKKGSNGKVTLRMIGTREPEVLGATKAPVNTAEEALELLRQGLERRATESTSMNATSSRSHAIFSVQVEQTTCMTGAVSKGTHVKKSQFHFCDLAGSERHNRTHVAGASEEQQRALQGEATQINMGLLALGNVISALGDAKRGKSSKVFVPYRDSKLTLLLKGSLGGDHHTLMIACVSPAVENKEESLNCLRYANRAKNIKNHVVVNVDQRSQLLDQLEDQMQSLANELLVAYKQDSTGGTAFETLLEGMASGDKVEDNGGGVAKGIAPPTSIQLTQERDPNRRDSFFPQLTRAIFLQQKSIIPVAVEIEEDLSDKLTGYEKDIKALQTELDEAKRELNMALASERNPPDDDDASMSDISEQSFPSRIDSIERFASHDSSEIRSLRRRLCHRLESLQVGSDEYQNMKMNYEKVRGMSLALQEKEDARTELAKRIHQSTGTGTTEKSSSPYIFQLEASKHVVYASAFVYCGVMYSVASTIYKVYISSIN